MFRPVPALVAFVLLAPTAAALATVGDDDAGSGTDAPDGGVAALPVEAGTTYDARVIPFVDHVDQFSFHARADQTVMLVVTPFAAPSARLVTPSGQEIRASSWAEFWPQETGTYRVRFTAALDSTSYSFTVVVRDRPVQDDAGSGVDAGDAFASAVPLPDGASTGFMDFWDAEDHYRFEAAAGETVELALAPPEDADFDLYLYDADLDLVAYSIESGDAVDRVAWTAPAPGPLYARGVAYYGEGTYVMTLARS